MCLDVYMYIFKNTYRLINWWAGASLQRLMRTNCVNLFPALWSMPLGGGLKLAVVGVFTPWKSKGNKPGLLLVFPGSWLINI